MMQKILITGGAGFAGSNIAIALKQQFYNSEVVALDNLYRKGSELNVPRLEANGVEFVNGDVRNSGDLNSVGKIDFIIECSAEPSVLSGKDGSTDYLIQTNLQGAINCADLCLKHSAGMIFLSTSRVYPIVPLVNADIVETDTRFEFTDDQLIAGLGFQGISEDMPMTGSRSLYGGTKYSAEIMLEEYREAFGLNIIINRCGVLAGPWQFGKADQGIATFWTAAHYFNKKLKYIGFNGSGKQVRDILHIDDLIDLLIMQIDKPENYNKEVFNVGGGHNCSVSLLELTDLCSEITGNTIEITPELETRYADIPIYISDNSKISAHCGWSPKRTMRNIIADIHNWLNTSPEVHSLFQ